VIRRALCSVAILLVGATVTVFVQRPTFRTSVDMVSVGVSVHQRGEPVAGLAPDDFESRDQGVPQQILDASYEKLPVDVTVALDVSDSVTGGLLDRMRAAIVQLTADLAPSDRLKLLTFNVRIRRVLDFDDNRAAADSALSLTTAGGTTALVDTLAVALMAPAPADRRHLVIVFSDGIDTASVTPRDTLLELTRYTAATATFVLPATGGVSAETPARRFYDQVADETGGLVVSMQPGDDLGPTFRRVLADFRSSYVLHFTPKGVEPGGVHALDVRVKRRGVDVRSRRSYAWR
jgi:Ca-activated chloride channel family protein